VGPAGHETPEDLLAFWLRLVQMSWRLKLLVSDTPLSEQWGGNLSVSHRRDSVQSPGVGLQASPLKLEIKSDVTHIKRSFYSLLANVT